LRSVYSSGNEIVDEIAEMNFTGNLIPAEWYKTIVGKDNKPKLLAINILADFVYWYRPIEQRDEATGAIVGYRKKFKADLLQRSYRQIEEQFGVSKKQARTALDYLSGLGVIKKWLRDEVKKDGTKLHNVMYIEIVPKRIKELTFPKEWTEGVPLREPPYVDEGIRVDTYKAHSSDPKVMTNTYNTTENTSGNIVSRPLEKRRKRNKFASSNEREYSEKDFEEMRRRVFIN